MVVVSSWGRLTAQEHNVRVVSDRSRVNMQLDASMAGLPHGMGRSYGDVCLNPGGTLWLTTGLDRFIHFDEESGVLNCEAGVLLRDIQRLFAPRGWMLPVTPGTQWVTVGGAIANDVHGKNHHAFGTFGNHVRQLTLVRTQGETICCGPADRSGWFAATVGGLGLTGIITQAEIQLRRVAGPWIEAETIPFYSLDEFFSLADGAENDWEHTVSWIDCLSPKNTRGLFIRGRHSLVVKETAARPRSIAVPMTPGFSLFNRLTLGPFNAAYFNLKRWRGRRELQHYESFFYPLDNLQKWNRLYGPRGFFQYQCVVPRDVAPSAMGDILKMIAQSGEGSFLAVLKTFGQRDPVGMLSFARQGVTLALDFPNRGERTQSLFERLDAIVSQAKGAIYPAKDARMPRMLFETGYPRLPEFINHRDPGISSALSRRLMGH